MTTGVTQYHGWDAEAVIARLSLAAHPEGGHFREVYRSEPASGERGRLTTIYYLLAAGERSHWHRIDADEVWHYYAGAPLALSICGPGNEQRRTNLGMDLSRDERPVAVVPAGTWQSADPWANGPWSAARWRRPFSLTASNWPHPIGRPAG